MMQCLMSLLERCSNIMFLELIGTGIKVISLLSSRVDVVAATRDVRLVLSDV
jgi:hypothetical protein